MTFFLTTATKKSETSESKAHRLNKEKLKVVLAIIDSIDDDELGDAAYDPKPMQHSSLLPNIGSTFAVDLLLSFGHYRSDSLNYSSDCSSPSLPSSPITSTSTDKDDLAIF